MHHILKTDPAVFRAIRDGVKNFEVRFDDRAFQTGDTLQLIYVDRSNEGFVRPPEPFNPNDKRDHISARITFVLRGGQYGIKKGYVVLALADIKQDIER